MTTLCKLCFTIFILISSLTIKAQVTRQWVKSYNNTGLSQDIAYGIAVDNSGNSYVTGSIVNGTQRTDYATIKYDPSGVQEWIRIYNGKSNDLDYGRDIVTDNIGNAYVTGSANFAGSAVTIKYSPVGDSLWVRDLLYGNCTNISCDASNNIYVAGKFGDASVSDYLLIKYSSSGSELWNKKYNGSGNGPDVVNGMVVDNSGNVYVTGSVYIGPQYAIATVKYNSSGVQMWDKVYNSPEFGSDEGRSIDVDNLGNVFVTGYSDSTVTGRDFITIKYNSSGDVQWIRRYHDGYDEAVSVKVFDDNNIYVTGPSLTATRPDDFTIIKYNSSGVQQWLVRYNGSGGADRPNKMLLDTEGNIYITGMSQYSSWEDVATVKYSPAGVLIWDETYSGPDNYPDTGLDMALDNTGNVYVTGRTYTPLTTEDYITIKYSQTTGIHQISAGVPDKYYLSQNYPNPFNPSTKLKFGILNLGFVTLEVYDVVGRKVSTLINENKTPGLYEVDFDGTNFTGGVYFLKLSAGEFVEVRKMVLVK